MSYILTVAFKYSASTFLPFFIGVVVLPSVSVSPVLSSTKGIVVTSLPSQPLETDGLSPALEIDTFLMQFREEEYEIRMQINFPGVFSCPLTGFLGFLILRKPQDNISFFHSFNKIKIDKPPPPPTTPPPPSLSIKSPTQFCLLLQ